MLLLFKLLCLILLSGSATSWFTSNGSNSNRFVVNEEAYLQWLKAKQMGSFKHALFQKAKNKFKPCLTIKVNKKSKSGDFVTLKKALNSIPVINNCRVIISIGAGTYREKIEIPGSMSYITLEGAGAGKTTIEWDDTADKQGQGGHLLGTYGSATFAINSPYFIAKNITFKNKAPSPPSGALGKQAVALRISADTAAFIGCKFIGAQDTLYDHIGRHYFKECYIEGSVDFIFGNGLSLYDDCHLHAITNSFGALTAQKRESMLEETGFSFVNCKVTGSGALYLGRAWGTFSRVVFAYTYMDKIITPTGWYDWGDKNREMTVFYGQYKCSGPGAQFGGRVSWSRELTEQEAKPFVSIDFIDGQDWLLHS
ncbi:Pectinesterase-2 precursor, putative [Ricinus communis]|uniref:Pectinesterase n=1 Tax=Ricinus communis TaxID=3988 RepID=B9SZT7_RICCO|nr:Pectinesterase-2 precursor, putative [Ricinus communis]|eukprot:XP_002531506.1 probable pectinesterase 53 [Ricinus communis]